jgi:ABC-2 type transport system permease protein
MKAFAALVHRELIEHRGAFVMAPLILVAVMFVPTLISFATGRVDGRFTGFLFSAAPMRVYEYGFLAFGIAWCLYLIGVLFFYAADGFSADKRNNAMLFWKSMPVSDFKMLLAKLTATLTILPGMIYAIALLSALLLFAIAFVTSSFTGGGGLVMLGNVAMVYVQIAASLLLVLAAGLLWYLPFIALVGAIATVVGRWAIPLSGLVPLLIAIVEWVVLGGISPAHTHTWDYLAYRGDFYANEGYIEHWFTTDEPFSFTALAGDLLARTDWLQMGIGAVFAIAVIYLASEYRRRVNDN